MSTLGSYSILRTVKAKSRWKAPDVPEYNPNWEVRFYLGLKAPVQKSARLYPICEACVAVAGNPVELRENCKCIAGVRRWANEWLKTQTALMQRGELVKLQEMRAPKRVANPKEVFEMWKQRGPADAKKRYNSLRAIFEQATGRDIGQLTWDDLNRGLVMDWAELRQEAGRRGWLGLSRGRTMPEGGWALLRELKAKGGIAALDKRTAKPWNTSINGYLVQAKSIFGQESRQNTLRELTLPPLAEFLETSLNLPEPTGHKTLSRTQLQAILEGADVLRRSNPRLWVVNQLLMRLACRPIEIVWARPDWIEESRDAATGVMESFIVIVNREDQGFELKAGAGGTERVIGPLPADLLAAVAEVGTATSIIGAKHQTEAIKLINYEHSQWLRKTAGLTGSQTNYLLRHLGAAERMTSEGADAAAALLGHSGPALVQSRYGRYLGAVKPVGDEELLRRLVA